MKNYKVLSLLLLILFSMKLYAGINDYTIDGEIEFKGKGTVHIFLVDEHIFTTPEVGLKTIVRKISSEELSTNHLYFRFTNVTKGKYGIRVYIDKNDNQLLDRGTFGPKEPWGMSYKDKKTFGKPKFSQIEFFVYKNIKLKITVE